MLFKSKETANKGIWGNNKAVLVSTMDAGYVCMCQSLNTLKESFEGENEVTVFMWVYFKACMVVKIEGRRERLHFIYEVGVAFVP